MKQMRKNTYIKSILNIQRQDFNLYSNALCCFQNVTLLFFQSLFKFICFQLGEYLLFFLKII